MKDFRKKLEAGLCPPSSLCKLGHDQSAYYEHTGHACPCVEKLLPKPGVGHHEVHNLSVAEAVKSREDELVEMLDEEQLARAMGEEEQELSSDEDKFRAHLENAGLNERLEKLLELRILQGLTFTEIATELKYADRRGVFSSYREALKQLRRTMNVKN